jgi:hypothetical protein
MDPYTWEDYFNVGTVVQNTINVFGNGNQPRRSEIIAMRPDTTEGVVVDLKELKTGYVSHNVTPAHFYFDTTYYKNW